jgi:hypothetical protein
MSTEWKNIKEPSPSGNALMAALAATGPAIPPQQRLLIYSANDWEEFVQEWAHYCLKKIYKQVQRFAGAGDMGIDIAGFADDKRLTGVWDNYQCKHYDKALMPSDVWPEFGKIIWYSYTKQYVPPRHYYFVAPWGSGPKLTHLLANETRLREELIANWDNSVKGKITATQEVPLDDALRVYVDAFDFSIFSAKTSLELIENHRSTPAHAQRFGGGLGKRPVAEKPPMTVAPAESRYVTQLLGAYGEHTGAIIADPAALSQPKLKEHFRRQREAFYEAESLRVFARDTVPSGTFESFQDDIFTGVIDTHDADHADGYQKVCAVTKAAKEVQITANALIACTNPKDRDGICHQLVNEERLRWTTK